MRFVCWLLLFLVFSIPDYAQGKPGNDTTSTPASMAGKNKHLHRRPPFALLGLSSGINNPSGILGIDFEFPVKKYITLNTGLGWSSWGNKIHLDGKYFFNRRQLGWAMTGGFAYNSGVYNFRARLRTENNGRVPVTINMQPIGTFYLGCCKYYRLGRTGNRYFFSGGYNFPLIPPTYQSYHIVYNGPALAAQSSRYMKLREPGGIMLGTGILFGLHHYN